MVPCWKVEYTPLQDFPININYQTWFLNLVMGHTRTQTPTPLALHMYECTFVTYLWKTTVKGKGATWSHLPTLVIVDRGVDKGTSEPVCLILKRRGWEGSVQLGFDGISLVIKVLCTDLKDIGYTSVLVRVEENSRIEGWDDGNI